MSAPKPSSITVEEAVARMISLDYIPTGFTSQDMTLAFLEDAESAYEDARSGQRERHALRGNVCEARHALAQAILAAIEYEFELGDESGLVRSDDSSGVTRVTMESLSEWAGDKFGIGIPEWEPRNQAPALDDLRWEDITIKIYADHQIGCLWGDGKSKRASFVSIDLKGTRKNEPNQRGAILIGLSLHKKFPPQKIATAKDKTAICKLRRSLALFTGLSGDPFRPFNEADGWKPRFKLIDDRRNADERAKARAQHVDFDETQDYEREGDSTDEWIDSHR